MIPHYRFPESTEVNRRLPKEVLYQRLNPSAALRQLFISQIQEITWRNKLAADTMNIGAGGDYSELHVFDIELKNGVTELDEQVLQAIDSLIIFPIFFRLIRKIGDNKQVQYQIAYKSAQVEGQDKVKIGRYFASCWLQFADVDNRHFLPIVLNITQLYRQLLQHFIPLLLGSDESLRDLMTRVELIDAKRREIKKTTDKLNKEKQFNRKVVMNAALRQQINELQKLIGKDTP